MLTCTYSDARHGQGTRDPGRTHGPARRSVRQPAMIETKTYTHQTLIPTRINTLRPRPVRFCQ